ncbi:MAG: hypothetical protein AAF799_25950 [Myxococcota bacterium]
MATYPGKIEFSMFTGPKNPLVDGYLEGGSKTPINDRKHCKKTWGISELKLTCEGSSTSYEARDHEAIAAGRRGHFFFAPTVDSVKISWKLVQPDNAETLILELFRAGSGAPIWQRTLDAKAAKKLTFKDAWKGEFPKKEWIDKKLFPDGVVTAAGSPYMLKARAEGDQVEDGYVERFTYFDILVKKIELSWGGTDFLPTAAHSSVDNKFKQDTRAHEASIITGLTNSAVTTQRMPVVMPCNQFLTSASQMKGDYLHDNHKKQWGDGPRIPLLAKISLTKANGDAVHGGDSAKALAGLDIMWDWEGEDEMALLNTRYTNDAVSSYLALRRRLPYKSNEGPSGSTNCHADYGGKRGGGAVFPANARPLPNSLPSNKFAFEVRACGTRDWAALSRPHTTGDHAGYSGVLFQPSRMARDTYKVSAYVANISGAPVLDTQTPAATIRTTDFPDLPRASTGLFDMVREVNARYIRKAPSVSASNVARASQQHALAGVKLTWTQNEDNAFQNNYATYLDRIKNRTLLDKRGIQDAKRGLPVPDWFNQFEASMRGISQAASTTHAALTIWEHAMFKQLILVETIREYVLQKNRKFNGPRNDYNRWRNTTNQNADDSTYLLSFYNNLNDNKKAKIDQAHLSKMGNMHSDTSVHYLYKLGNVAMHGFKLACSQYMIETATANNRGFITFHVVDTIRVKNRNGTHTIVPSGTGGVAPSSETLPDARHAMLLVFLPDAVRNNPNNVYTVGAEPVIAHEMGHTFYLCHAPAGRNEAPAPGFSTNHHDPADLKCLMNYDFTSDHLCGLCNLKLRGWSLKKMGVL